MLFVTWRRETRRPPWQPRTRASASPAMLLYGKNPNNAFLQCINVLMFDAVALRYYACTWISIKVYLDNTFIRIICRYRISYLSLWQKMQCYEYTYPACWESLSAVRSDICVYAQCLVPMCRYSVVGSRTCVFAGTLSRPMSLPPMSAGYQRAVRRLKLIQRLPGSRYQGSPVPRRDGLATLKLVIRV